MSLVITGTGNIGPATLSSALANGATTMNSLGLANLIALSGGSYVYARIGPDGPNAEIVKITAHTAAATSATIEREQFGTTTAPAGDPDWPSGTEVEIATITEEHFSAGSAVALVATVTPASGVLDVQSLDLSPYAKVELVFVGCEVDTDDTDIRMQVYIGGVLFTTATQLTGTQGFASSGVTNNLTTGGNSSIFIVDESAGAAVGNAANESFAGEVVIFGPTVATHKLVRIDIVHHLPTGAVNRNYGAGSITSTGNVDGFRIAGTGGTIDGGTMYVFGHKSAA